MRKLILKTEPFLYKVHHEQYATDRYVLGETIVKAESKQAAMDRLNEYLATKPHGAFTGLPCTDIKHVHELTVVTRIEI